ncbi:hypothetical protein K1719_004865 [Acacia pycnantha]|nr:hypothetical protein K1719_004865 [Acacia pycnantha]
MDFEMKTSPSYFDPQDLNVRDQFRRYRKRHSTSGTLTPPANSASKSFEAGLLCDVSVQYNFCTKMLALDACCMGSEWKEKAEKPEEEPQQIYKAQSRLSEQLGEKVEREALGEVLPKSSTGYLKR